MVPKTKTEDSRRNKDFCESMNMSRHSGREQRVTEARPTATTCRDRPLRHEPALGKLSGKSLEGEKIAIS
jgi:hypothetical protein